MKFHEIFGKNISPQDAYILKITTNLVDKKLAKIQPTKSACPGSFMQWT